jgi:hypothetical protein
MVSQEPNWSDLQEQLDWYAKGVEIGALSIPDYLVAVRFLLDEFEVGLHERK